MTPVAHLKTGILYLADNREKMVPEE